VSATTFKAALPSLVSLASMVLGLISVVLSSTGDFLSAGYFILYCAILDKADGIVARALHVDSTFGMEMDSFSDFTAFGIAPAALLWFGIAPVACSLNAVWVGVAAVCYVACAAIRLARFNVVTHEDHHYFSGVPTTFAATIFAALLVVLNDCGCPLLLGSLGPSVTILLALLMISQLRIPKLGRHPRNWVFALQLLVTVIVLASVVFRFLPVIPLIVAVLYLLIGAIMGRSKIEADASA